MNDTNEQFFGRADEHILLSNKQIEAGADSQVVNASLCIQLPVLMLGLVPQAS